MEIGCGCSSAQNGGPCSSLFKKETIIANLYNCREMSTTELDLVIIANIQASTKVEDANPGQKRKRSPRCSFIYKSIPICKEMFLCLYGIGHSRYRSLKEHYDINGLVPRVHGNAKKLPSNNLSHSTVEDIKTFISNYTEENGIELPGRTPSYKNSDIKLLPTS